MKQIRIWVVIVVCLFGFATNRASAQMPIAVEHLYFSFFNDYEDDEFFTNSAQVNEISLIRTAAVITGNVDRALYYEEGGPEWTNMAGMELVREVNLTNGAEGIYLRGFGRQTNVSQFFTNALGISYTDHFTGEVTNEFPGLTNNFDPELPLQRGSKVFRTGQTTFTNSIRTETMFFISMNATSMKFNFVGYGPVLEHPVIGRLTPGGTLYSNNVESFTVHGVGTMYDTGGTNVFYLPGVPPVTNTGPIYGTFWSGDPFFLALTNGPE